MKGVYFKLNNYILDTNVLLHDPMAYKNFNENHVVVPAIVLEELDTKKGRRDRVGENARTFIRELMSLREKTGQKLGERIKLESGGTFTIEMNHVSFEDMKDFSDKSKNDNRILAVAKNIYTERKEFGEKTTLISMDGNMIAKADVLSKDLTEFEVQLYKHDRLVASSDSIHTGTHELFIPNEIIQEFKGAKHGILLDTVASYFEKEYYPSDFVIMKDIYTKDVKNVLVGKENKTYSILGKIKKVENVLKIIPFVYPNAVFGHIRPLNIEQKMMAEALLDPDISLICVRGEAGSGKTLLSVAASIRMMESENEDFNYKKLMIARPVVAMGKDIGFLPGELEDKLRPWMAPIYDSLEYIFKTKNAADLEKLLAQKDFLMVQALTYIRGRSLPQQLIIIDEAQNLTPHEVKTIISRAGEGTKVILLGDTRQIDHPYLDEINNGLTYAIERMKEEEKIAVIKLESTERSVLADLAVKLL